MERPAAELVEEVAQAYVEAGSQVILTNTFGANRFILARHQLADQRRRSTAGAAISLRAAGRALVFASIGPTGVMLMMGQTSEDELAGGLPRTGPSLRPRRSRWHGDRDHVRSGRGRFGGGRPRETGLPVVACMTFDSGAKKDRTMMGTTPEQASEQLLAAGADCVGSNCGHGIEDMVEICRRLHAASDRPVWIKANAGLPKIREGKAIYAQTAESSPAYVPALIANGAGMIGGCCGTTPEFIAAVRGRMKAEG